jgi:hypothetical protein
MKHTPTPWVDDNTRLHADARVIRHRGVIVARIPGPITKLEVEETEDNVRLLLASPEMFDLLREVYENAGPEGWPGNESEQARFVAVMEQLGVRPPKGTR